jgi:hypothetical protein
VFRLALGHDADHSPSIAKVKNGGVVPSLPLTASWCSAHLIKHGLLYPTFNKTEISQEDACNGMREG